MTMVQIVGGPNDGREVPYVGQIMREPVPVPVRSFVTEKLPEPGTRMVTYRQYELKSWWTGTNVEPRYILSDVIEGLCS